MFNMIKDQRNPNQSYHSILSQTIIKKKTKNGKKKVSPKKTKNKT